MKIFSLKRNAINSTIRKIRESQEISYKNVNKTVASIIDDVKKFGDKAIFKLTKQYDNFDLNLQNLKVKRSLITDSSTTLNSDLKKSIKKAIQRVSFYQKKKLPRSFLFKDNLGNKLGWSVSPLDSVGIYVPGGTASYPSSLIMTAVLARVAGVKRISIVTPPSQDGINKAVLFVADCLKIDDIYQVGGAQAIAALAYGTKTIEKVNKIVGPGNIFVATAKKQVFGDVGIDMLAGPSEVLIIGDKSSSSEIIAADLLAQAEHDINASSILVTTSKTLAQKVLADVKKLTKESPRRNIISKSLKNNGKIFLMNSLESCIDFSNSFAPEHLELLVNSPERLLSKICNAGSIFLGKNSAEAFGDYIAGPSHVLPTGGSASFSSPLSSLDFIKYSSVTKISDKGLKLLGKNVEVMAESESLFAHKNSISLRLRNKK